METGEGVSSHLWHVGIQTPCHMETGEGSSIPLWRVDSWIP